MTSVATDERVAKSLPVRKHADEGQAEEMPTVFSERVVSVFASAVFHAAVLLILALFVFQHAHEPDLIEVIEARMEPLPEPEAITIAEISVEERLNATDDTASSMLQEEMRPLANASEPPPIGAMLSNRGLRPLTIPHDGNGWKGDALAGLGESHGMGDFAGNGSEEEGDGEVGFFGTKAKGKSFVFIVDCSGSMRTPLLSYQPRPQGIVTRFLRARQELYLSLGQLARDQTFYIIFYNHQTYPMYFPQPATGMAPANDHHLGQARNWIQNIVPGGGTDPREAFQMALALRPEVIFFLTDGAIPPATRRVAGEHNQSRTRIHTIAFGLPDHHDILKGIAEDNQGRFRFVP
jgi:hypothetical protein